MGQGAARPWRLGLLAGAIAAIGAPAWANPTGAQVIQGSATLQRNGATLSVTTSNGAVIHWNQFSIGAGETTRFIQPSAASQVLNRVVSGAPSEILGRLESNGRVFLINPSGVAFGRGAQVDVGALVVSTLKLSNEDFAAGRMNFGGTAAENRAAGAIRNEGSIRTASGGLVYLVAPQVENSGIIHSPEGQVLLAAGHRVTLVNPQAPEVSWEVAAPESAAINLGEVVARRIGLHGQLVRNAGLLQATTAVVGEDGRIVLRAQRRVEQTASGQMVASGLDAQGRRKGGEIDIQAGEQVSLQGRIDASATAAPLSSATVAPSLTGGAQTASLPLPSVGGGPATVSTPAAESVSMPPGASVTVSAAAAPTASPAAAPLVATAGAADVSPVTSVTQASVAPAAPASVNTPLAVPASQTVPPGAPAPAPAPSAPQPDPRHLLAGGTVGSGGRVRVLGRDIVLGETLNIDVSGPAGGGTVLVGGDLQGASAGGPNAQRLGMSAGAVIRADATALGDGGKVILWADDTALIHGRISARGGPLGGDGGFIETSGLRVLSVTQSADASAPAGKGGTWLIDPYNLTIQQDSGAADVYLTLDDDLLTAKPFANDATLRAGQISEALNQGTDVLITTGTSGQQAGNIFVNAGITKSSGSDATLTFRAHNNIALNADIEARSGRLNLVMRSDSDSSGLGATVLGNAKVSLNGGTFTATTNGGRVSFAAGNPTFTLDGADATISRLSVSADTTGGVLTGSGSVKVTTQLSVAGSLKVGLSSGFVTEGSGTITGALSLSEGRNWTSKGAVTISGAGSLLPLAGATVSNQGTLTLVGTAAAAINGGVITNVGTITSSGTQTLRATTLNNGGVINVSAGSLVVSTAGPGSNTGKFGVGAAAALEFSEGSFTFTGGADVEGLSGGYGSLRVSGASVVDQRGLTLVRNGAGITVAGGSLTTGTGLSGALAPVTVQGGKLVLENGSGLSLPSLTMRGGTLFNTANVTVTGAFQASGSSVLAGSGQLTTSGNTTVSMSEAQGALRLAAGKTWVNTGTLTIEGDDRVVMGASSYSGDATLRNEGTLVLAGSSARPIDRDGPGAFTLTNNGTLRKTSSGSSSIVLRDSSAGPGTFSSSSTAHVDINAGTLSLNADGVDYTYNLAASATLDFAGGDRKLRGTLSGGTVRGAAGFTGETGATLSGVTLGGSMSLGGRVSVLGNLALADGATVTLTGDGLVFPGSAVSQTIAPLSGAATLSLRGAALHQTGEQQQLTYGPGLIISGYGTAISSAQSGVGNRVLNNGLIDASDAGGTMRLGGDSVTNAGTVRASAGNIQINTYGAFVQQGILEIGAGRTLTRDPNGVGGLENDGLITGSGTLVVGSGANRLVNRGRLRPGIDQGPGLPRQTGTLAVTGDVELTSSSVLDLAVGGTGSGQYDVLAVTGRIDLGGSLQGVLQGSPQLSTGSFVPVVTATAGSAGGFASVGGFGGGFSASYGMSAGEAVRLVYATGGTRVFSNAAGDLRWETPGNWQGGLPGAEDEALISTGYAVEHGSGSSEVRGLTINTGNLLRVTGGSLTVNGFTTLGGTLRVEGGSFQGNDSVMGGQSGALEVLGGSARLNGWAQLSRLSLRGGALFADSGLSVADRFEVASGGPSFLMGRGTLHTAGTSLIEGKLWIMGEQSGGFSWSNTGAIQLQGAGSLFFDGIGQTNRFHNQASGSITLAGTEARPIDRYNAPLEFTNDGVLRASSASAQTINATVLNNGGTLRVSGSGPVTIGGQLQGAGQLAVEDGSLNISGTVSPGSVAISGGSLNVAGALSTGVLAISGGQLAGDGSVTVEGAFSQSGGVIGGQLAGVTIRQLQGDLVTGAIASAGRLDLQAAQGALRISGGLTAGGQLLAQSSGDLIIVSGGAARAAGTGDAAVLSAGGVFLNQAGAQSLSAPSGRWLVYSSSPVGGDRGGLAHGFRHYGQQYDGAAYGGPGSGNGFLYQVRPTVLATLNGPVQKTYDGSADASVTSAMLGVVGTLDGDQVLWSPGAARFVDRSAGTAKLVTVDGLSLVSAGNQGVAVYGYLPEANVVSAAVGVIDPRVLTVNYSGVNRVYDGTTAATVNTTDNRIQGDSLSVVGSASFADRNAGAGKAVSVTGVSLSGADAGNYTVAATGSTTANIDPRVLAVNYAGVNRVYDGTTAASVTTTDNRIQGDSLSVVSSASFADRNAGLGKAVSVTGVSLSGADAGNYTVAATGSAAANIDPRVLAVNYAGVNRVYDGTTAATVTTTDNRIQGDSLSVVSSASFADRNAGLGKAVSVTGVSLSGADAGNYTVAATGSTTANIDPRVLAVNYAGVNRVYDGTTAASVTTTDNRIQGDSLSVVSSASFADRNAGVGKAVSVTGVSLAGTDAGNYTVAATGSTTANIDPRVLAVNYSGVNRVYDGTTAATVTTTDNRIQGDSLSVVSSASFADRNAGVGKAVSVTGVSLAGTDAGNYTVAATGSTTANIDPRVLAVNYAGVNRVYDGTTAATVTTTDNRIQGDSLSVVSSASFADRNAGVNKPISVTGVNLTGADAGNYTVAATGSTTAN
ncbi:MAG: YDG domain-containing protein, partial [Burkholderiales bacterium]